MELDRFIRPGSYQQAEVDWYKKNGKHKSRIVLDSSKREYVVCDSDWKKGGRPSEFIEHLMWRDINQPTA